MKETKRFIDRLAYLYDRWQDEKDYEDIADYLTNIKTVCPTAYEMTKRPFGVKYTSGDMKLHATVKSTSGGRVTIEVRQIGGAKC